MLIMSVTGVQELVLFIINLLTSTYVCLITLAVGGSLHVAVSVAEDVGDFLNSTIKDVGKEIGDAADGLQGIVNGFMSDIGKVGSFLSGKEADPPKVDFTDEILGRPDANAPSAVRGDAALLAAVNAPRGDGMRDIVATIQSEQD